MAEQEYTENGEAKDRKPDDKDALKEARERLDVCYQYYKDNNEQAVIDLRFSALDQWPESVRQEREQSGRPCLTLDRLNQVKNQVVNDIRQSKIALKAVADDSAGGNPEAQEQLDNLAEIRTSILRDIQYKSHAPYLYALTAGDAVGCGIGNMRVVQEYANDETFDQELRIKKIPYPLAVYWDPAALEPDRSDADFCFIVQFYPSGTFKRKWPKAKPVDVSIPSDSESGVIWSSTDGVLVAEYYRKVYKKEKLTAPEPGADGKPVERDVERCTVEHLLITGSEVLEGPTEVPGKHIPVVAVIGEEIHLEKKRVIKGLIRGGRDAQQLFNYSRTKAAEDLAMAPKATWLGTVKQFGTRVSEWATAHKKMSPILTYTPDSAAASVAPQRIDPPQMQTANWQEAALFAEDIKAGTGIYDASLGNKSNETSGVAIQRRQQEGDVATFHYIDNLQRSLEYLGTILLDQIPLVYDTQRTVRLMDDKDEYNFEQINTPVMDVDPMTGMPVPAMINDMTQGKFGIRVSIGPSYTTQRMEAAAGMLEYIKADPDALPMVRDLVARAMDWPDADEFAERFKKSIDPKLLPEDEKEPEQPDPMAEQVNQLAMKEAGAKVAKTEGEARKAHAEADQTELENAITERQVGDFGIPPPDHLLEPAVPPPQEEPQPPAPQGFPPPPQGVF